MHKTISQVCQTESNFGEREDLAGLLDCMPECAWTLKKRALRRSVSQNATICLVPRISDELVRVAVLFLALLFIRSWLLTILAAALFVGSE